MSWDRWNGTQEIEDILLSGREATTPPAIRFAKIERRRTPPRRIGFERTADADEVLALIHDITGRVA
ncbi:hypothetical protein [Maritimibacter sp. 55A14]|uniref:hypothetical protein n=1 Tax=Maritimibacter sp. 55A14 TaxID=2174844 RepID=UPI0011B260A1|nr:hypothetical protein [Maritimibacter sp. 55A14]